MGEDGRAIAFDVLVEPDAGAGLGQDGGERGLIGAAGAGLGINDPPRTDNPLHGIVGRRFTYWDLSL
jgi:hypothetical protein